MSDEDIIRIANQAGWDVQNLDDGFGERLRRFAQDLERQPLYTAPSKREWVGLTDEEIFSILENLQTIYNRPPTEDSRIIFAKTVEQALKEKNHG